MKDCHVTNLAATFRTQTPFGAILPQKHCIKRSSGARYTMTYIFFLIANFLDFGSAVTVSGKQWSSTQGCIQPIVKFTSVKEITCCWNLAPSVCFCCLIQLPGKCSQAVCRGKTTLPFVHGAKQQQAKPLNSLIAPSTAHE